MLQYHYGVVSVWRLAVTSELGRKLKKATSRPLVRRLSRKCGSLNFSQPHGLHCLLHGGIYLLPGRSASGFKAKSAIWTRAYFPMLFISAVFCSYLQPLPTPTCCIHNDRAASDILLYTRLSICWTFIIQCQFQRTYSKGLCECKICSRERRHKILVWNYCVIRKLLHAIL
jgi:hypothetical protein